MTTFISQNPLLTWAFIAGILTSILGGAVGPFVVVKRIAFIAGSIAHSVLAGIGLFVYLEKAKGFPMPPPIIGALLAAVCSALFISRTTRLFKEREDSLIALVWASGMALGILLLSQTPGYTSEISSVLIGNILWVNTQELVILAFLALLALIFITLRFQQLKLLLFDHEQAFLQKIPTQAL